VSRSLPAAPNLEQLRRQAKELLRAARAADPEALARLQPARAAGEAPTLAAAQRALAREYGFPTWPRLRAYAERTAGRPDTLHPFRADLEYYEERAEGLLSVHASGLPSAFALLRRHHPRLAGASDAEIAAAALTPADARLVFAREHGFSGWPAFARHIRGIAAGERWEPFRAAFVALKARDSATFRKVLEQHPYLVRAAGTNGNTLLNLAAGVLVSSDYSRAPAPQLTAAGLALVRVLLDAGADPNQGNHRGWTPLHQAGYSNHAELARLLLESGAAPDREAHGEGGTPLVMALFWGHQEASGVLAAASRAPGNLRVAAGLGDLKAIRDLVPRPGRPAPAAGAGRGFYRPHTGFPVWRPSSDPQEVLDEALVWAAKSDRVDVLAPLVELGARVDADPYRGTALLWAAANGRAGAIRELVRLGAAPSQRATFGGPSHGQGITALHLAAQSGHLDACRTLLDLGADPDSKDDLYASPPWGWARHFGQPAAAELIRERSRG
jgi:ankyrin repeat protein